MVAACPSLHAGRLGPLSRQSLALPPVATGGNYGWGRTGMAGGRERAAVSGGCRLTAAVERPRPGPCPRESHRPASPCRGSPGRAGRQRRPSGGRARAMALGLVAPSAGPSPSPPARGLQQPFSHPVTGLSKSSFEGAGERPTLSFAKLHPLQSSPALALPAGQDDLGVGLALTPPTIFPNKPLFLAILKGSAQT